VSSNGDSSIVACSRCGLRVTVPTEHVRLGIVYAECRIPGAAKTPQKGGGPGTEMKKLLATVGITASPTCSCNARAALMDEKEASESGWCEAHMEEIVGWLHEEATKRGLPFLDAAGRLLVRRAIANARRRA
jgi:hypothetical protein